MAVEYTHKGDHFVFENYIPKEKNVLFYIETAGYTHPRPWYHIKRGSRLSNFVYVLEYVLDGKGYIIYDGKKYTVNKGDFYMVNDNYPHEYYSDPEKPLSKLWINVRGSFIDKVAESMSLSPVTVHTVDVEENFRRIHQLLKGKTAHEVRDLTEALMAETVNLLYKVYLSRRSNSQSESRFLQIKDYIGVHITDDITIEKICEEFFISKSTLYRLFKNEMDISPTEYIKRLKIDIACKILKKTDIDINEISRQLGFYDNSHFFRTFSSIKGMSPSAYRRNATTKPKV